MIDNSFSKSSLSRLETCHSDLILVAKESLKVSQVDFGISQGARTIEEQQQYYNEGKSKVNPSAYSDTVTLLSKGKHLIDAELRPKSWAFDFYAYVPGESLTYDMIHLMFIVGVITATAERLRQEGKITHKIRSGTNWDRDGELKYDQSFFDAPHIEMI